jgi:hypothetical protein
MTRLATRSVASLNERCDGCGAAAKVQVELTSGGELTFCGHHANRYADRVVEIGGKAAVESGFAWRGAHSD